MSVWPNWVDLVIIAVVITSCYNGFARGLLAQLLSLVGTVLITVITVNYSWLVTNWLEVKSALDPGVAAFVVFWGIFLGLSLGLKYLLQRMGKWLKWERVHWAIQGIGLFLGGVLGLWWAGFFVIVLTSSGFHTLQASVEERSILGPGLLKIARRSLVRVADELPGATRRPKELVPSAKILK